MLTLNLSFNSFYIKIDKNVLPNELSARLVTNADDADVFQTGLSVQLSPDHPADGGVNGATQASV
jgi:hypothetical protein